MSEESNETKSTPEWADRFLQLLVDMANDHEGPLPLLVTLNVKGLVICGRLINRKTYFEEFSRQLRQAFEPFQEYFADIAEMEEWFRSLGEPDESEKPTKDLDENELSARVRQTQMIHLKDATIHQAGAPPLPSEGGLLWRGRLSSVDGFSLGAFRPDSPDVWTAV